MKITIFNPILDEFPQGWTEFVEEEGLILAWRPEALRCVAHASEFLMVLGIAYDNGGKPAGVISVKLRPLRPNIKTYSEVAKKPSNELRIFECSLPLSFSPGLFISSRLTLSEAKEVIGTFEKVLFESVTITCPFILYRRIPKQYVPFFSFPGRLKLPASDSALLENNWTSMDDYFRGLPGKYRKQFQKLYYENQNGKHFNLFVGTKSIDPVCASRLALLTQMKHLSSRSYAVPIPLQYFEYLSHKERVYYFGYENAREGLLAFDIGLADKAGYLYTTVHGSNYNPVTERSFLYFDLYLREIEFMIQMGLRGVHFGPGLIELKKKFGCVSLQQNIIVRSRLW